MCEPPELIEEVAKFSLPQAKILFIIHFFSKYNKISLSEKFKLKGKER